MQFQTLMAAASICLLATGALAGEITEQDTDAQAANLASAAVPKQPKWETGIFGFGYSQPAYPGADERTNRALVLPYVIYRGKYLVAERGSLGVRTMKTPRAELDLGFGASLGSNSSDIAARQGMEDLGTMIEVGPRLKVNLGDISSGHSHSRLQLPLRAVIDISYGFRSRGVAFEPEWVTDRRLGERWFISTSLSAKFGDEKLNSTYYGVAPYEATPTRPSYVAKSGLIALRAGLIAAQTITPDVRMFYTLRLESLTGAANHGSPLVLREQGWYAGIGLAWALARSDEKAYE